MIIAIIAIVFNIVNITYITLTRIHNKKYIANLIATHKEELKAAEIVSFGNGWQDGFDYGKEHQLRLSIMKSEKK